MRRTRNVSALAALALLAGLLAWHGRDGWDAQTGAECDDAKTAVQAVDARLAAEDVILEVGRRGDVTGSNGGTPPPLQAWMGPYDHPPGVDEDIAWEWLQIAHIPPPGGPKDLLGACRPRVTERVSYPDVHRQLDGTSRPVSGQRTEAPLPVLMDGWLPVAGSVPALPHTARRRHACR